jgi:hypothetical protein
MRRRSHGLAAAAVAALLAPAALGTAGAGAASGQRTFAGSATGGTGAYRHLHAGVRIALAGFFAPVPSGSPPAGTFIADLVGSKCSPPKRCLTGRLTGNWRTRLRNPDAGSTVTLTGAGTLTGLGAVTMTATGHGPGYIAAGRMTLTARLKNRHGSVSIAATGPQVPGFTAFF